MSKTVLIVDDDPTQRRLLQAVVEKSGFSVLQAGDGDTAVRMATGPDATSVDVMLLDLIMPGRDGMDVLTELAKTRPELPVIVLTAKGSIEAVVSAMKGGARDFVVKPAAPERIVVSIRNALEMKTLSREVTRLKKQSEGGLTFDDLIGKSAAMRPVVAMGERGAKASIPILISGESGVGKEVIARAIQGASERADKPFISVNCGAIPETLVESILFGHEKGSFTGANGRHLGKFQEAHTGTLFLDEIGELPLDMQVKLLRVLQEGEVDPIGSKRPVSVDVRIVSATNRDLAECVAEGTFREDLFYRLNVFPIAVPPLRERTEDIPALVEHFVARFNAQEKMNVSGLTSETLTMLGQQPWEGNVRQLENAIFRAMILSDGNQLRPSDFPQISGLTPAMAQAVEATDASPLDRLVPANESDEEGAVSVLDREGHLRTLEDIERDLIAFAIETYHGHMSEVARRLGIGRSTLYRKVREHALDVEQVRSA
ncbi:sigma-54-dependent Fis family transcriptional regulator [Algimonas ampicilliniresistens]|jgi:DNA-binding NtrC family response regulator|uniref:DNA-binding transcriptional regulator NtrC n=1 Tax=Algimonas ampicilliniresistens TaxID=1298735 RepID=A0ABQ5V925_9PROT|nr:sigma-54 dependent transcriptional regulator [Algimonas ampicilliniresistens]GLQ22807.1 sigma-54-dependent Fis family transcriptional regulator [Algimonas ampicilliniresistens]